MVDKVWTEDICRLTLFASIDFPCVFKESMKNWFNCLFEVSSEEGELEVMYNGWLGGSNLLK